MTAHTSALKFKAQPLVYKCKFYLGTHNPTRRSVHDFFSESQIGGSLPTVADLPHVLQSARDEMRSILENALQENQ